MCPVTQGVWKLALPNLLQLVQHYDAEGLYTDAQREYNTKLAHKMFQHSLGSAGNPDTVHVKMGNTLVHVLYRDMITDTVLYEPEQDFVYPHQCSIKSSCLLPCGLCAKLALNACGSDNEEEYGEEDMQVFKEAADEMSQTVEFTMDLLRVFNVYDMLELRRYVLEKDPDDVLRHVEMVQEPAVNIHTGKPQPLTMALLHALVAY